MNCADSNRHLCHRQPDPDGTLCLFAEPVLCRFVSIALKRSTQSGATGLVVLDEFGHLSIPGFEIFGTTARKYKIAFTLFLQSMAQLDSRYGALGARTIQEALATEIYLPGMALDTARALEARLGRQSKGPLMAANDLIRMKDREALILHSNQLPSS